MLRARTTFHPAIGSPIGGELIRNTALVFLVEGEPRVPTDLPAGRLTVEVERFTIGSDALVRHARAAGWDATLQCATPRGSGGGAAGEERSS